jgi:PHD/YefM family antitoxin component YafN of YafNO toxin-antitoxin module
MNISEEIDLKKALLNIEQGKPQKPILLKRNGKNIAVVMSFTDYQGLISDKPIED